MPLGYIDPGAGSLLIQALIAAAVTIPFALRNTIRSGLNRMRRGEPPTQADRQRE